MDNLGNATGRERKVLSEEQHSKFETNDQGNLFLTRQNQIY